jgi:hypothetical protein
MANRTARAIDLVRKVVDGTTAALAKRGGALAVLREERNERLKMGAMLGERAIVKVLHMSTAVAQTLARAPFPEATATQRLTLEAMASQLRSAAAGILSSNGRGDVSTLEGALSQAVEETLRLVDAALAKSHELDRGDDAIQVRALGERSKGEPEG